MMDRFHSALNPGENAHKHQPHGCYLSCGWASLWWLCISSTAHPHRLHTDAVLLPFTLLLLQHQLIHTQTHFVFLIQPLFLYFYWPFLTQFNFSISQWGAEALSAVWSDLPSALRPVQVWGARGEPLEDLPLVRRTVPSRLRPGALREARPHPLRQ